MTNRELNKYAFIGWLVYEKKFTIQQIEDMPDFDFLMLMDDWEKFKNKN